MKNPKRVLGDKCVDDEARQNDLEALVKEPETVVLVEAVTQASTTMSSPKSRPHKKPASYKADLTVYKTASTLWSLVQLL